METVEFPGMEVFVARLSLKQGQRWTSQVTPGVWCATLLQGAMTTSQARHGTLTWGSDTTFGYSLDQSYDVEHLATEDSEFSGVFVRMVPDAIENILGDRHGVVIPPAIPRLANQRANSLANSIGWQMLGCPLEGTSRRLYLSGKALELLAVILESDLRSHVSSGRPDEIERVYEARSRILQDLRAPPAIPELARHVGLNAHRLNVLFKNIFGTSVYAYIKTARLDQAKLVLETGQLTIAQIAYRFGYQPAHFATAFRKQFGCSPSRCVARGRTNI